MEDLLRSVTGDFRLQMPRSSERKCKGYAFVEGAPGNKSQRVSSLEVSKPKIRQWKIGIGNCPTTYWGSWLSEGIAPIEGQNICCLTRFCSCHVTPKIVEYPGYFSVGLQVVSCLGAWSSRFFVLPGRNLEVKLTSTPVLHLRIFWKVFSYAGNHGLAAPNSSVCHCMDG